MDLLGELARSPKHCVALNAAGCIAAVVGAMQAHLQNDVIQANGCDTLAELASCREGPAAVAEQVDLIMKSGGTASVIGAMRAHPEDACVQNNGCDALAALARHAPSRARGAVTVLHGAANLCACSPAR